MTKVLNRFLDAAKAALILGQPARALDEIEKFMSSVEGHKLSDGDKQQLERRVDELRQLALSAQVGAQSAIDKIRGIVEAARSLQTYDKSGNRHVSHTATEVARRF